MDHDPHRAARWAINAVFFVPGVALATWASRTPAIREGLGASTEQMGLVLFGFSLGSMLGILSAGRLTIALGPRRAVGIGLATLVTGLSLLGAGVAAGQAWLAFAGFLLFGAGMGWGEIGANIDGVELERITGRPLLPMCHGFFSLGTLAGAGIGMLFSSLDVPVLVHLVGVAVVALLITLNQVGNLSGRRPADPGGRPRQEGSLRKELASARLLLIGFLCMALALAEGSANDWLPILMIDGHGFDHTTGTAVYLVFTVGMTVGRFCGGWVVTRLGRAAVLRLCALSASVALALVIFSPNPLVAACAVILWGFGASLGFPLAISAAGEGDGDSATRVSIAATLGYMAFLVGPPLLGFLGEHFGMRHAMLPVLAVALLAIAAARAGAELRPAPGRVR